jgi:hypothetical protein
MNSVTNRQPFEEQLFFSSIEADLADINKAVQAAGAPDGDLADPADQNQ